MLSLSAAACAMSLNRLSIIVLMMLIVTGALMVMDGIAIGAPHFMDLEVPGLVIGFAYGIAVLVLGLAKAVVLG